MNLYRNRIKTHRSTAFDEQSTHRSTAFDEQSINYSTHLFINVVNVHAINFDFLSDFLKNDWVLGFFNKHVKWVLVIFDFNNCYVCTGATLSFKNYKMIATAHACNHIKILNIEVSWQKKMEYNIYFWSYRDFNFFNCINLEIFF